MKTPLQEFYEFMEQNQYFIGNDLYAKYHEMIEKEKEVIMDAYDTGLFDGSMDDVDDRLYKDYYNETFNTKEE